MLAIFWFVVQKTPLGRAQRACEQDRKMAALVGVNVDRTISLTFVMGAALAAVAGTMYLMYYGVVNFNDGFTPGVKAFTAAVLGGIGSLPGAVLGGILIGLIEALWSAYFSIDYKDVASFSILAIVLIFLPSGPARPTGSGESLTWRTSTSLRAPTTTNRSAPQIEDEARISAAQGEPPTSPTPQQGDAVAAGAEGSVLRRHHRARACSGR